MNKKLDRAPASIVDSACDNVGVSQGGQDRGRTVFDGAFFCQGASEFLLCGHIVLRNSFNFANARPRCERVFFLIRHLGETAVVAVGDEDEIIGKFWARGSDGRKG